MINLSFNSHLRAFFSIVIVLSLILTIIIAAWGFGTDGIRADFKALNQPPSWDHWFGTDWMGRDMFARTLHGLTLSLQIGLIAASFSTLIAITITLISGLSKSADVITNFIIDIMLSMPHLILLLLICFALGGGTNAVIIAVAVSHWPRFARILRAELMQLRSEPWIEASQSFGRSRTFIIFNHILPHLLPQLFIGFLLMFPHAILHEASLTFLGIGLETKRPAIGIILSEAMRHIYAGRWWLTLFPGLALLTMVLSFDMLANRLRRLISPREAQT